MLRKHKRGRGASKLTIVYGGSEIITQSIFPIILAGLVLFVTKSQHSSGLTQLCKVEALR